MQTQFSIAIIGLGSRGANVYGRLITGQKDKFRIVALCDLKPDRVERYSREYEVPQENCFTDDHTFLEKKRADVLVIATPDAEHIRHATAALELGYDVLLEKPISPNQEELDALLATQKKYGGRVLVCHVLRYAPAFVKMGELLREGAIGKLIAIRNIEHVAFWHHAHSYVRGNWRVSEESSPMIMAKCCHDLDLLQYYAGSRCKTLSSIGSLDHFKAENAPEGATARCVDCPHQDTCPYSAKTIYVKNWHAIGDPLNAWPYNVAADAPLTEEKLMTAIENGPYGRCVYHCDNNVVDNQIVSMEFENGVKAELTMMAFTRHIGRRLEFFGTHGDMILDETRNELILHKFQQEDIVYSISDLVDNGHGHGGGDAGLVHALYEILCGNAPEETSLERSIESHLMAIYAEESRLNGGKVIHLSQVRGN